MKVKCSEDFWLDFDRNLLYDINFDKKGDEGGFNYLVGRGKQHDVSYEQLFAAYAFLLDIEVPAYKSLKLQTHYRNVDNIHYIARQHWVVRHPDSYDWTPHTWARIGCQSITKRQATRTIKALADHLGYEIYDTEVPA